jgi:hypothetical protein
VTDTAILEMIRRSLSNPNGALAGHKSLGDHPSDVNGMLVTLIDFWAAVKRAFPKAWGKPPSESRLMHSAGIAALGDLMDRIAARATSRNGLRVFFARELSRLAPDCAWTDGTWPRINRAWDDFQTTSRDIRLLSQILVQLYAERTRR